MSSRILTMRTVIGAYLVLLSSPAFVAAALPVHVNDYTVDASRSLVIIHVSRAGMASALGHDHLISSRQLSGTATYASAELPRSQFSLQLLVNTLVVDDPVLRKQAGGKYAKAVSESARESTRRNMLSDKVLDAAVFGEINVQGRWQSGNLTNGRLALSVSLHGVRREMNVPVQIEIDAGKLIATGKFQVRQSDFAIKPFTTLAGALAVADMIEVNYRIVLTPGRGAGGTK
ncbi:MAG: YceI family protein [Acidiferrobacterales bacterium]|jgi:polyisoprenoid-binding protein YceI|nr:YceI family protein [Acidiferrobacterales bacterium]